MRLASASPEKSQKLWPARTEMTQFFPCRRVSRSRALTPARRKELLRARVRAVCACAQPSSPTSVGHSVGHRIGHWTSVGHWTLCPTAVGHWTLAKRDLHLPSGGDGKADTVACPSKLSLRIRSRWAPLDCLLLALRAIRAVVQSHDSGSIKLNAECLS